jgi:hypothetical protein
MIEATLALIAYLIRVFSILRAAYTQARVRLIALPLLFLRDYFADILASSNHICIDVVNMAIDSICEESLSVFSPLKDVFHDLTFVILIIIRIRLIPRLDERQVLHWVC